LLPRDQNPRWSSVLGKTALKINLQAKPSPEAPITHYDVNGRVGDLAVTSNGSFVMASGAARTSIKGVTEISSPSSATLVNLFGGAVEIADAIPSRAVLTADGVVHDNFQVDLQGEIYRSTVHFTGSVNPDAAELLLDGDLAVQSSQAQDLLAALRIPALGARNGNLTFATKITTEGNKQFFDSIEAKFADLAVSGSATLENQERLTGDFSVGDISLLNVLAPVFLPWNGRATVLEESFAKTLPFGLTGEVWLRPKTLEVYPGFAVSDAQIGIAATAEETRIAVSAKTADGDKVSMEIASAPLADGRNITGQLNLPIDLFQNLKRDDGASVVSGSANVDLKFNGVGRSPSGALATLNGQGIFTLADGKLLNVTPANFSKLILAAQDAGGLKSAFDGLHGGDGIKFGTVSGSVKIVNGIATFTPFDTSSPDAEVRVKTIAELADGKIDIGVVLSLKALPELPPMEISYTGMPTQLVAAEDRTALASYLGFKVLEKGVDELEKVQKEQERLAFEEEELRKDDEERLTAFYAQKAELRLRLRELKVQSAQRALDVDLAKAEELRLIREGEAINKSELRLRLRELRVYRKVLAEAVPAVTPREKPVAPPEAIQVPLILVPPGSPR